MHTLRISHPAFQGAHREETIDFYTRVLGMELVLRQPNLDYEPEEHLFFHVGNDNFIAYFVPRDEPAHDYPDSQPGSGHMDHLSMDVDGEALAEACERLRANGYEFEGPI